MSENATPEERTEMPTERRMNQLRKDGLLHFSSEVAQVSTMLAGFLVLTYTAGTLFEKMQGVLIHCFGLIATRPEFNWQFMEREGINIAQMTGPVMLSTFAIVSVVGVLAVMLQTDWNIRERKINFRFSMLNPINGVKRIFSIMGVMNTLKALVKLGLIIPIAYYALADHAQEMVSLVYFNIPGMLEFTGKVMGVVFWKVLYILIAIAVFDYIWSKYQWLRRNKMTKAEVKDERKAVEGDEETKRRIQAKGMQRIMQRIRQTVPTADVVITNPTHYAVALKYDRDKMNAPTVVAKGVDHLAQRIKELARESGVPVIERKALARALYSSCEVGSEIPRDLFKAAAEVLAYVYKLKNPNGYNSATANKGAN